MITQGSLQTLEQISQIACFSIDYKEKSQAQNYFLGYIKNLSCQVLLQILKNGSQNLIFVTIEYANKLIDQYPFEFLKQIFNVVENQVSSWYLPESHQFRRKNTNLINNQETINHNKYLTNYVLNSICLFLSNCMKKFFIQDTFDKRSQIVTWISSRQNQRYKLWLYKIFIQNISQIDSTMGFIKFRSLSYNFQEQVIPIISKHLIPFLYQVQNIMQINQLSHLQQHLNVQQNQTINYSKNSNLFQNENQFKFAKLIFELLHSIVYYNFHLTYTEYQQESTFDNCLICFPEEFTSKVVTQQFITSIGYVIQKLIDTMPESQFLKIALESMQKIFLTKLSYVDENKKIIFVKQCALTLTKILIKNNLNHYTLTKIMVCNNKFVTNIEINYFKEKQPLKQAFQQWLLAITKTTFLVLQHVQLSKQFNFNQQDSLIIQCLELYQKIAASSCSIPYYSFEEPQKIDVQEKAYIQKNIQKITQILIKKLLVDQTRPLIQDTTAEIFKSNIIQIKSFCSCFFQPFKQLASLNYGFLFTQIQKSINFTLQSEAISIKFNLFMLLTEVIDRNFLERNITMVKASEQEIFILSKCVSVAFNFLDSYMKKKMQIGLNEQIILMDMSILIFLDKILSEFLGYFENHENNIQLKHRIFQNILKIQNKGAFAAKVSEEFLLFCIESVLSYLLIYNKNEESKHINDFIFETINRILMKFKWGIKREIFKGSQIYARLSQFFNSVSKQTNIQAMQTMGLPLNLSLFNQFQRLKWRKKLLKVMALLYFDDVVDDYRLNLENLFYSLKNQHILTILLDIEGIGQAIDTTTIYKTFLQKIQKYFSVERLTNELVHLASSFTGYDKISKKNPKIKIIKQIIKMHKAVLSNKGQRIGNSKNMQSVYLMIKQLIGYWIDFLKMSDNEDWVSVIKEIISIVTELIKCDKINFYLIQRVCKDQYGIFFNQLFLKMLKMIQRIQEHPKLYQQMLQNLTNVSRELLEVIFFPSIKISTNQLKISLKQISETFIQLFLLIFKKILDSLQEIRAGNTKNELNFEKCLQIVKFTLTFIDCKRRQSLNHRDQMQNLNSYVNNMKQHIFLYANKILQYLTAIDKQFSSYRRTLIIILYEGAIIYPDMIQVLIGGMNLPNYLINQVKQSLQCVKREQQQLFIDRFKIWLRMVNMSEQQVKKSKNENNDFYGFMAII